MIYIIIATTGYSEPDVKILGYCDSEEMAAKEAENYNKVLEILGIAFYTLSVTPVKRID